MRFSAHFEFLPASEFLNRRIGCGGQEIVFKRPVRYAGLTEV